MRFRCQRTAWLFCLVLLLVCTATRVAAEPVLQGKVSWVYDGDTIKVDGIGKVRLVGIDTPEKNDSPRDNFYRRWQVPPRRLRAISRQALEFCISQARGEIVTLTLDTEERDRHGRLLAYVSLPDGRLLNRLLIERGLATTFRRFNFRMKEDFLAAEKQARAQGLGLWQKP